jgi:hypothetical protein
MTTLANRCLALLAALGLAAGCSPKPEDPLPPPPPATITAFTVTPTAVAAAGDTVTITWATENATSVSLEQLGAGPVAGATATSGSATATVAVDTAFVLTARGEGGTDARSVGVTVPGGAQGVVFEAIPDHVEAGVSSTLTWYAPGARAVSLEAVGAGPIDLGAQLETGAIVVTPQATTTYRLTVDGKSFTDSVTVSPVIDAFALEGALPLAGQPVKLAWRTRGATSLTVTREGVTAPLVTETDAAKVAAGDFTDTAPADLPAGGVLAYTLTASVGAEQLTRELLVYAAGTLRFTKVVIPPYGRTGSNVPVSWQTTGADSVRIEVGGQSTFVTSTAAEVASGNAIVDIGPSPVSVKLIATNTHGERAEATGVVEAVGPVTFNAFTATPSTIANGGGAVTLAWDVTNARRVKLSQVGGGFTSERRGVQDTGSVVVRPNRPTVTYRLEADNQAGDAITPQTVTVTVTNRGVVNVARKLPVGNPTNATGTTVADAATIYGLPFAQRNAGGAAFVDIAATGTDIVDFMTTAGVPNTDDGAALVRLPGMDLRVFGRPVDATVASVSTNGWFTFSAANTATAIPAVPVTTNLLPLSIVPFGRNLALGPTGRVQWRQDVVSGVDRLIIQWTNVQAPGLLNSDLTFQAQVYATGEIVFAYQAVQNVPSGYSVGVVNADETTYLSPAAQPGTGDTVTFFKGTPVSALPVTYPIMPAPSYLTVGTSTGALVEALLDDALVVGDLAFTELNPRPALGLTNAEWIELTNSTATAIDLEGWSMGQSAQTYTFPAGVTVPANGRLLLAQSADLGNGAAVAVGHLYPGTFTLPDASGQLTLRPPGSTTTYARFDWNAATAPANGRSVQADPGSTSFRLASPFSAPTCPAPTTATYGTTSQQGTPGASQPRCFPYVLEPLPAGGFESLLFTGTPIVLATALTAPTTYPIPLPQPVSYFGAPSTSLSVCSAGWLTTSATTSTSTTNKSLPSSTAPTGELAPFWDNLVGDTSQTGHGMYWIQRDPDRVPGSGDEETIVSWEGWRGASSTLVGQFIDFQVKLRGNGDLEFHYGRQVGASDDLRGLSATTWLGNPAGNAALAINVNSVTPGIQGGTGFRFRYAP